VSSRSNTITRGCGLVLTGMVGVSVHYGYGRVCAAGMCSGRKETIVVATLASIGIDER